MNKIIRTGVFETNSSSCHSIAIAGEDKQFVFDSISPDSNGVVSLTGGEYGWSWFKTNSSIEKANYAAQQLGDNQNLINVIRKQTGADKVVIETEAGYVDHQSTGLVEDNEEWLKNFIFNKNSWLFGGNDNSDPSDYFYDVPEWRDGKFIDIKYNYALRVEGYDEKYLFKSLPGEDYRVKDAILRIAGSIKTVKGSFQFYDLDIEFGKAIYRKASLYDDARKIVEKRNPPKDNFSSFPHEEVRVVYAELAKIPENQEALKFWIEKAD